MAAFQPLFWSKISMYQGVGPTSWLVYAVSRVHEFGDRYWGEAYRLTLHEVDVVSSVGDAAEHEAELDDCLPDIDAQPVFPGGRLTEAAGLEGEIGGTRTGQVDGSEAGSFPAAIWHGALAGGSGMVAPPHVPIVLLVFVAFPTHGVVPGGRLVLSVLFASGTCGASPDKQAAAPSDVFPVVLAQPVAPSGSETAGAPGTSGTAGAEVQEAASAALFPGGAGHGSDAAI
jgi:hypothetical protein